MCVSFDNNNDVKVSTSTGSLSHYYNLAIIVPRAYILGADEYYAMAGGDISLVCIIEDVWKCKQCQTLLIFTSFLLLDSGTASVCLLVS